MPAILLAGTYHPKRSKYFLFLKPHLHPDITLRLLKDSSVYYVQFGGHDNYDISNDTPYKYQIVLIVNN